MTNTIFFFNTFHKCQYLLSMYEPNMGNKVVVNDDLALLSFVKKIIPTDEIIVVPKIRIYKPLGLKSILKAIKFTIYCKFKFKHLLNMPSAVFFSDGECFEQWVLLKYLSRHNVNITFYNCYNQFERKTVPEQEQSLIWRLKLKLLKLLSGLELSFSQAVLQGFAEIKLEHNYNVVPPSDTDLIGWNEIRKKFNFSIDADFSNSLLIIDGPVQIFEIKEQETLDNLISFFERQLQIGKKIFLKPHYGAAFTSFDARGKFLKSINIIDKSFPVELIMDSFPEIYFFTSTSVMNKDCNVKKYCLHNLVEFKDAAGKDNFCDILKYSLGDEYDKINFVQLKDII